MAAASALLAGFGPGALGATPASAPSPDTEATPVAKDGCQVGWQQVAGDVLSAAPCDAYKPDPAGVPFSVDFFAARFSSESNGYAGGAECISASGDPAGCARTPVLYHYVGATRRWAKVPLPAGGPGFIGALAYIDRDTMLAVGGDGSYPRREPAAGAADPAGGARVWVIRGGSACELGNGSSCGSLRDGMRGLTAVDCSPDGSGFCVAGGYRQLWMWRDGRFVANYDDSAGQPGFPGAASFLFRVRAVRFNPDPKDSSVPQVSAATSGCCDANPANDAGAIFGYDGSTWSPQGFLAATGSTPESFYALTITPASASGPAAFSVLATPGGSPAVGGSPEPNSRIISSNSGVGNSGQNAFNPLYFAQGPDLLGEFAPRVSGLRLLSGDGDLTGRSEIGVVDSLAGGAPDGFMDWAVGVQTASGQGMAYTTTQRGTFKPSPFSCPIEVTSVAGGVTNPFYTACRPDATGAITQTQARSVYALPSYGLNSFTMLPTGVGWAVGDRGGILRLGGEDSAASTTQDSSLPSLGGHKPGALSDGAPYDGYRPLPSSSQLGHVPALDSRALLRPAAAQWVAAGSPDPNRETEFLPRNQQVTSIVMSRDGSEGWAVGGPSGGDIGYQFQVTTLYHYVGGRWSSCDPDGIAGVSAPDPACASLAGLRRYKAADGAVRPVNLLGAARIPTESGSDPSRAGDFEVVAVGTKYRFGTGPEMDTVLRYAHGRWSFDHDAMSGIDPLHTHVGSGIFPSGVAFSAPDDGWLLTRGNANLLYHFDQHGWSNCSATPSPCDDHGELASVLSGAPNVGTPLHLLAVGTRVYLYGSNGGSPAIIYHERGARGWTAKNGGWDPHFASPQDQNPNNAGRVDSLSLIKTASGYAGWATGVFGASASGVQGTAQGVASGVASSSTGLLALTPDGLVAPWPHGDIIDDYLTHSSQGDSRPSLTVSLPGSNDHPAALIAPLTGVDTPGGPMLGFDPRRGRWAVSATPFSMATASGADGLYNTRAAISALAPDGRGGVWAAAVNENFSTSIHTDFYHYTSRPHQPVFDDVPNPFRDEQPTAAAGGGDGSLWVTTRSRAVFRYDRLTGWERLLVPGWDPDNTVTIPSAAHAVAVGADGTGLMVGKAGRIANLSRGGAVLDDAAGADVRCGVGVPPPCGTGQDLRAVAVAPDGSALVGGDGRALLWRPAGQGFRAITKPSVSSTTTITGVSLPEANRAWLTTSSGHVFAGRLSGSDWTWQLESETADGTPLTLGRAGQPLALRAVSVDGHGHGFAVGDRGMVLQRLGDGAAPWRRVQTGLLDNLHSLARPAGGGNGALVGGENGLVLTWVDGRFEIAHTADPWDPISNTYSFDTGGPVVGTALTPGLRAGQVEAWVISEAPSGADANRSPVPSTLLHYTSDPAEPLLQASGRVRPLADAPAPRPGEIVFDTFGKQECRSTATACPELTGSATASQRVALQTRDEILSSVDTASPPQFALFTGDANDSANQRQTATSATYATTSVVHRRWIDFIEHAFADAHLPLLGAIGTQDLSSTPCSSRNACGPGKGANLAWRQELTNAPAPWGSGDVPPSTGQIRYRPVADDGASAPGGGAHTHYALDVERNGTPIARIVVIDSSLGSLTASDAAQNPIEAGGQSAWLRSVLCIPGQETPGQKPCSRTSTEQAIVVSETPTYSYGPGQTTDTATDAATLDALLQQYHANLVVSGRLGWNALYWATAPGLHSPCPGESYPDPALVPGPNTRPCTNSAGGVPGAQDSLAQAQTVADSLQGTGPPAGVGDCSGSGLNVSGVTPTVIAASAGGKFGADGQATGTASQGFWHGYTIVRLDRSGDPRCTIVEQRPVFDWVDIAAATHVLNPGQHVTLKGFGREPVGTDQPIRYDDINSFAITHRYDLLKADPKRPYLPATSCPKVPGNPQGYCELSDPSVGSIDPVNGRVVTGRGNHPRVYAIGLLSVGQKAASWPLVFEPRRSYSQLPPARVIVPANPAIPQVHVAAIAATSPPPPPSAPPPAPPSVGSPTLPQLPGLPGLPPLNAPPPAAPPPPAGAPPPAPPASQAPSALSISITPQSVGFAPPSGVVPPPAPPINPAPPGGARREAKAKQPAAAKSEESGEASEIQQSGGDAVSGPPAPMTRLEQGKLVPSYTFLVPGQQASAWSRDALYGGGLVLAAAILALGYTTVRPTPRRRTPSVAAPAWAKRRRGP